MQDDATPDAHEAAKGADASEGSAARSHRCPDCGIETDLDGNAARNLAARARDERATLDAAFGRPMRPVTSDMLRRSLEDARRRARAGRPL